MKNQQIHFSNNSTDKHMFSCVQQKNIHYNMTLGDNPREEIWRDY